MNISTYSALTYKERSVTLLGMGNDSDWQKREDGVAKAIALGYKKAAIARNIGTDGTNLGNILRRKSKNSRFVPKLDEWLEQSVWSAENLPVLDSKRRAPNLIITVSSELRVLADYLENPELCVDDKIEKFSTFVTFYSATLPRAIAAFKKSSPSGE